MENVSCLRNAAVTITSLMVHHLQVVTEILLHQPLPLDHGTQECWKELGTNDELGLQVSFPFQLLLYFTNRSTI